MRTVDAYPLYAASALAANAFVRCAFAGMLLKNKLPPLPTKEVDRFIGNRLLTVFFNIAAFPLFGLQMYSKLGYQWGSSLLAFLTVAMMPFPYLFFVYGKRLRKGSRFAARN